MPTSPAVYGIDEELVRQRRLEEGLVPPSSASTPAPPSSSRSRRIMYGTYEQVDEAEPTPKKKVVILGSGPNRIGQGIEFDYCCCHAVFGFREEGFETVMVNCNPETVSTDYDTADRLYFEPLTFEDVMADHRARARRRRPTWCARAVWRADAAEAGAAAARGGRHILGTSPDSIDLAEDRQRFSQLLRGPRRAPAGERHRGVARGGARGGRADRLSGRRAAVLRARRPRHGDRVRRRRARSLHDRRRRRLARPAGADRPVPRGRLRVRRRRGGRRAGAVVIGGIMEHIEEAGIHSGDSSCVVPPFMVAERHLGTIREYTRRIARALKVVGLMNIQYAIKDDTVYVLEVNPRSSRTVPYISKATGVPMAKIAARVAAGRTLAGAGAGRRSQRRRRVREEPGVPVRALPGRRHDPRSRR